jgi:IS5 family transposase
MPLFLAQRVLQQERHQRRRKIYSLHAPEVECIFFKSCNGKEAAF